MYFRTHNCGELRETDAGKHVKLSGWLDSKRDKGGLLFAVLRDFYGTTQVVCSEEPCLSQMRDIPTESTVSVEGTVVLRSSPNDKLPTGLVEVIPERIEVLGRRSVQALPFEVSHSTEAGEDARLKYRFLDLRNPAVRDKIILRSQIVADLRKLMTERGFYEINTPILTSSSPEGARDYIVPSRIYPGEFYALPQAPQQYKQLLMCSGFDKYFQIAPCFRDEDARADRSPGEFYQLDIEMAFATQEDVFEVLEGVLPPVFAKYSGWDADKPPFRRVAYREALETYGSDKPDLRNPLVIKDVSDLLEGCGFAAFEGKKVKAIAVNGVSVARKWIDKTAEEFKSQDGGRCHVLVQAGRERRGRGRHHKICCGAHRCLQGAARSSERRVRRPRRRGQALPRPEARGHPAHHARHAGSASSKRTSTASAGSSTSPCTRSARRVASSNFATIPSPCRRAG